jgi:sugar/nucleoside kinase (ribokinase family)
VDSRLTQKTCETGISIVVVTPDHERTMFTFLGACREVTVSDIDFSLVPKASLLHITGYMWDTENQREITKQAVRLARDSETLVSFDIADPFVVNRYRGDFLSWIPANVDLLFGNHEEFSILAGGLKEDDSILAFVEKMAGIVVMKTGAAGACVCHGGNRSRVPVRPAQVVDTTGAGDSFAGGFLFELLREKTLTQCAETGNSLAAAVVEVEGCDYEKINLK